MYYKVEAQILMFLRKKASINVYDFIKTISIVFSQFISMT